MSGDRQLGPELVSQSWTALGDSIMWFHVPSRRSVVIEVNWRRNQCSGCLVLPGEPATPETVGCIATWSRHDELGNPVFGFDSRGNPFVRAEDGGTVWTEHWADAIRIGIRMRAAILSEYHAPTRHKQLTFDDYLEALHG